LSSKVLLVFPGVYGNFFPEIPLPLIYISWALRKSGYDPEIFDMRLNDYKEIRDKDYLFVGITSMTGGMIREGLKFVKYFRALNNSTPIVWGGVHVTLLPEQSLQNPYVDIVVRGEGENTVQELACALSNKSDLARVKGISFKRNGSVINNPDRPYMDLNTIDMELPYDLIDMKKYSLKSFPVHTSRGCPYRCGFCYNVTFNKRRYRCKTAERTIAEIEYIIKKFKVNFINFFSEDEFFIDVKRVQTICAGILSKKLDFQWGSFCRFDSFKKVDIEMLKTIEKSGCVNLGFGAESGSKRILEEVIKKDITIEDIKEGTKKISATNIRQIVSFMSGLPTETDEDMDMSFNLIDELAGLNPNIYFNGIVLYTPYPGTPLYETVINNFGYKIPDSLEKWADYRIYRDIGNTWHSKKYLKKYKALSVISRFPFWKKSFSIADIGKAVVEGGRFTKFPINIMYWIFSNIAMFRWKHRNFSFPLEFTILEKVLERIRGFV
jgi:anaerobic magnesium-protoporphyrin IX monomethyl ester cyclase